MRALRCSYVLTAISFALPAHCCPSPLNHPVDQSPEVFSELAADLSPGAAIVSPGLPEHERWQAYKSPTYSAIVEVAVEEDVQKTVRFANKHCYPFLAVDGAHGLVPSLAEMQGGVAISFVNMKGIWVDDGGEFAELEPGLTDGDLVRDLWEQGKQTSTGVCLCAGVTGVMLGGGHGYLQGLYGLVADQVLEARVVLADDGSCVTASREENDDLFWALRGAGHNFGIVTSLKFKVYDRFEEWSAIVMFFSGDQLEEVFELSNNYIEEADHPPELEIWHLYTRQPDLSDKTVIRLSFVHKGSLSKVEPYAAPFRSIGPLVEDQYDSVPYLEIFEIEGMSESSRLACDTGLYRHLCPMYLMQHNATALRTVYNIFDDITEKYPDVASHSLFIIEGYSIQGVTAVPSESTAVPFREFPLLVSAAWGYADAAYISDVRAATREMREALLEGSGSDVLSAYVNYAFGDETLPELYGHEPWRLRELRRLKEKYDSGGAFSFYMPIE